MAHKLILFAGVLLLLSCTRNDSIKEVRQNISDSNEVRYATGFQIEYADSYKKVTISNPYKGSSDSIVYILSDKPMDVDPDQQFIQIPIESIVCTSTTHIPLLEYLGVDTTLVGFPNQDYISSKIVRKSINAGKIQELGHEANINTELLVALNPELVMTYTVAGGIGELSKVQETGIPVVLNAEYLEPHPLGRAEWIKFIAAFYNLEERADSVFSVIEKEYLAVTEKYKNVSIRPTVLSGVAYGDTWFLPGGQNYASKILYDAGGDYLWASDSSSAFIELGFEAVYGKAIESDFWIGVASFKSLSELADSDDRYSDFKPYKAKSVYSYTKRIGEKGGNEFLELGYFRPDLIVKDLALILHPDIALDHQLFFFEQLK